MRMEWMGEGVGRQMLLQQNIRAQAFFPSEIKRITVSQKTGRILIKSVVHIKISHNQNTRNVT